MASNRRIATGWGKPVGMPRLTEVGKDLGLSPEGVRLNEGRAVAKLREGLAGLEVSAGDRSAFMPALRDAYQQRVEDDELSDRIALAALALQKDNPKLSAEEAIRAASKALFGEV